MFGCVWFKACKCNALMVLKCNVHTPMAIGNIGTIVLYYNNSIILKNENLEAKFFKFTF